jgi:hypothetical protein
MKNPNFEVLARRTSGSWVKLSQHRCPAPAERKLAALIRDQLKGPEVIYEKMAVCWTRTGQIIGLREFRKMTADGVFDGPEYR